MKKIAIVLFISVLQAIVIHAQTKLNMKANPTAVAKLPNMTGVYIGNDGGAFYVAQRGNTIYWFGEHPEKKYAIVFFGNITENKLDGKWFSVPKYGTPEQGALNLVISENGNLFTRTNQSKGFDAKTLKKATIKAIGSKLSQPTTGTFGSSSKNDLDGTWICSDGATYYLRQVNDVVVWFGESKFTGGQPGYANVFVGKRNQNKVEGYLVDLPKGRTNNAFDWSLNVTGTNTMAEIGGRKLKFDRIAQKNQPRSEVRTKSRPASQPTAKPNPQPTAKPAKKKDGLLTVILPNCKNYDRTALMVGIYTPSDDPVFITNGRPVLQGKDASVSFNLPEGTYLVSVDYSDKNEALLPYQSKIVNLKSGAKLKVQL